MQLDDELALSYYAPCADINAKHSVQLVQHTETGKFYVKKQMKIYNTDVMKSLRECPVRNTPQIYVLAEDEAGLTVIEEYISGETLQEVLDREGPLPEARVLDIALQLCDIVAQLHHRTPPIVHRDIKPANLILSPDGVVKLLDFNAAKYADAAQSRDTVLLGTSGYAAPEQYGFGASAKQTDLYAVGVLMNIMLTGCLPTEKPAAGRLAGVIIKCTQLKPTDRFSDADELIDVLRSIQNAPADRLILKKERPAWTRFLPPGFRTGSSLHMCIAVIGYLIIILCSTLIDVETDSVLDLAANHVMVLLILLYIVFFSSNYLNIQNQLPLSGSRNPVVRIIGIVFYDLLGAVLLLILFVILENRFLLSAG